MTPAALIIAGQVLAAYIVADAFSGIYHLATDLGWNIESQRRYFEQHHRQPETMTFDLQPLLGALPIVAIAWFALPWFFGPLAFFVAFAQIPHYYVHHSRRAPISFRVLSLTRIVLSHKSHEAHHNGVFDRNFCILSGWNDWWLNPIALRLQRFKRPPL